MEYDPDQGYPVRGPQPIGKTMVELTRSRQQLTLTSNASAEKLELAAKYTKLLLGCYRMGDANDPEVYTAAIIAIFSDYSEEVMRDVADPRRGLPSKIQWLPTVKEVREACEKRANQRDWVDVWEARSRAQIEERARLEYIHKEPRETWAETKADLERRGFKFSEKPKLFETAEDVRTKYGISQDQWNAIPDLPPDFEERAQQWRERR